MGTAVINTHAKFPAGTDFVGDQNVTLTAILLHFHKNRTLVCIAARAFSAICVFQALLIGFVSVKTDVGSTGFQDIF